MLLIKNNVAFVKSMDQIATFVDECNVHFTEDGLKIIAFDNAQIIYLEYELSKDAIEGELPSAIFGINIVEFNKIISKINSQDKLYLEVEDNSLEIIIKGSYDRTFSFPQKIIDEKELSIQLGDYPVKLEANADILKDVFNCARVVSDSIVFDCKSNNIDICAEGIYGKYKTQLPASTAVNFKAKFSAIHLGNMLKNASNETKIEIKLRNSGEVMLVSSQDALNTILELKNKLLKM